VATRRGVIEILAPAALVAIALGEDERRG
jgi:hypothetical protein